MREMDEKRLQEALTRCLSVKTFSENDRRAVRQRIGGKKTMKRKLSASVVLAMVLLLALGMTAVALTQSGLLAKLYGAEEDAPQEMIDQLVQPQATVAAGRGEVVLDEYLYDGAKLNLMWTLRNPTAQPLLYMVEDVCVNGVNAQYSWAHSVMDRAYSAGWVLGGAVEGETMPQTLAFDCEIVGMWDEESGVMKALPDGNTATITMDVHVFNVIGEPMLIDNGNLGDDAYCQSVFEQRRLPVDEGGESMMDMFVTDDALWRTPYTLEDRAALYEQLGWLTYAETIPCAFDVTLSAPEVTHLAPEKAEWENDAYRIVFEQFSYTQAGGECRLRVYPKTFDLNAAYAAARALESEEGRADAHKALNRRVRLTLVAQDGNTPLVNGRSWGMNTDKNGDAYVEYTMELVPTAQLPGSAWLAEIPENGAYDMENALEITLVQNDQ